METFPRHWTFVREIRRSPVNSLHKGQWRGALMFSLICVWINGWVNNREAGGWRRYRAHYDVTVMHRVLETIMTSRDMPFHNWALIMTIPVHMHNDIIFTLPVRISDTCTRWSTASSYRQPFMNYWYFYKRYLYRKRHTSPQRRQYVSLCVGVRTKGLSHSTWRHLHLNTKGYSSDRYANTGHKVDSFDKQLIGRPLQVLMRAKVALEIICTCLIISCCLCLLLVLIYLP